MAVSGKEVTCGRGSRRAQRRGGGCDGVRGGVRRDEGHDVVGKGAAGEKAGSGIMGAVDRGGG